MLNKEKLKDGIRVVTLLPFVSRILYNHKVRRALGGLPGANAVYGGGWDRLHPFDRLNGTDTSGTVSAQQLQAAGEHEALAHVTVYGGSQPSVLRTVLSSLPNPETCVFLDLGCGKGRPLLVASEFPFRDIVGVELSPELARVARANAVIIGSRFPSRTPIRVEVGDATAYPLPAGNIVLFLYHPFGTQQVQKTVRAVEAALALERRVIYVVLYNPVNGACCDASPGLTRRFARMMPYAPEERGYGPDVSDAVVIWQGGTAPPAPADAHAHAKIVITNPGSRAELVR
jgi:SAM-dependent methyltransferase